MSLRLPWLIKHRFKCHETFPIYNESETAYLAEIAKKLVLRQYYLVLCTGLFLNVWSHTTSYGHTKNKSRLARPLGHPRWQKNKKGRIKYRVTTLLGTFEQTYDLMRMIQTFWYILENFRRSAQKFYIKAGLKGRPYHGEILNSGRLRNMYSSSR